MRKLRTLLSQGGRQLRGRFSNHRSADHHSANRHSVNYRGGARRDDGMNTAEYAVGTLAAVAFAGVLLKVLTSDAVRNALSSIVQRALQ